jgi:gliding motility-associatede transport system auxiliary component
MLNRILSIVGWLGTALVFAAVAVRFLKPEWQQYASWAAWAGLACVVAYTLGQWRDIAAVFKQRQTRFGTIAATSVLVVLGILIAVNYLSNRRNKRWDLTSSKEYTLSDQSRKILGSLDAPVKALVFAQERDFPRFKDSLSEYEYASKNKLTTEYVDADRKPVLVNQYKVQSYNTVVFEYKGRTERVVSESANESDLTNALIKVITGQQKKIYFTQGHGEKDTAETENRGYSRIAAALGSENYGVDKVVLAQQTDVPADATVVLIAGPKADLLPNEVEELKRFLRKGGKLGVLIDPPERADSPPLTNLFALLKEWSVDVGTDLVIDPISSVSGTGGAYPAVASYPRHPITEGFNRVITMFPLVRSVSAAPAGSDGKSAQSFIETSPQSWAETDLKSLFANQPPEKDTAKGDKAGPISIGVAVSAPAADAPAPPPPAPGTDSNPPPKPETRVAVLGDSDFVVNNALQVDGNRDLFINMVGWLAQQENLLSIRPRQPDDRRVTMTEDQQRRVLWLSLLVIPGAIMAAGIFTWWQRR